MTRQKILIIEDEPLVTMQIELALQDEGLEVLGPAISVRAALLILDEIRPDCVTLDYRLFDGSAAPVAKRLAELKIPFVLCSGNIMSAAVELEVLPNAVLEKPFMPDELAATVRRVLAHSRPLPETLNQRSATYYRKARQRPLHQEMAHPI